MNIQKIKVSNVNHIQPIKVINAQTIVFNMKTQEKSVIPAKEEQIIKPDIEYDALSKVIVEPIPDEYIIPSGNLDIKTNGVHNVIQKASVNVEVQPNLQDKQVIVKPNENIDVISDEDFDGLRKVNVIGVVDTETVEATPTKEVQTINRSENKYIESVKVNAIPDEYIIPSGNLDITENGSYDVKDKESVNVEIASGGGDLSEYFTETINLGNSSTAGYLNTIKKLPAYRNTGTRCDYMFYNYKGAELDLSNFDISLVNDLSYMFYGCSNLISLDLSNFDTSSVTTMNNTFRNCSKITELDLSNFDTRNLTNLYFAFYSCSKMISLDLSSFDASKVNNPTEFLNYCYDLVNLKFVKNLGKGYTQQTSNYYNYSVVLNQSNNLSYDSLMNVINNLYDLNLTYDVANGGTLYTQQLKIGSKNMTKLTDEEIAIATNKGWSIV